MKRIIVLNQLTVNDSDFYLGLTNERTVKANDSRRKANTTSRRKKVRGLFNVYSRI